MAQSRLEIKKRILEDLNKRAEEIVDAILLEAEISKTTVDASKMTEMNAIINRIEGMKFDGNIELLRDTVNVYDRAIKAIDEQLESENMQGFEKFSEESLKEAKKLLEEQSKDGRVGTIFAKVEELSKAEKSGEIEERYNDEKIEELDYSMKEQKEAESKRLEPFNKIIAETRESREELDKVDEILNEINNLAKEREELLKQITSPDLEEEEKEAKKEKIKEIDGQIIEVSSRAKMDEKDKMYDIKKDEKIEDYIKRIQGQLTTNATLYETKLLADLQNIKDLEVDLGPEKKKVEEYLKDCMSDVKKLHGLTNKLAIDKAMLKRHIEKTPEHKEMQKLENKKKVYEQRNHELEGTKGKVTSSRPASTKRETTKEMIEYNQKFDWRHPIKSIKNMLNRKENSKKQTKKNPKQSTALDKMVLREVEKSVDSMGKGFRDKYKVEDKDRISAEVETELNTKREKFYADIERQEAQNSKER